MLSSEELSRLGTLELIARAIVEGAVAGGHRSPFHGYSAEFTQYRSYRQGDDFKYVDWKLFARSDRLYTKQFRETTNASVIVAVDASASMDFGGGVSKARYAQMVAAAIAFIVSRQGDAVGLLACGEKPGMVVPPRSGAPQLTRVLAALERLQFRGRADVPAAVRMANDALRSRALVVFLSDLYDLDEPAHREFRRSVRAGHDVSVFQIVSRSERRPAFDAGVDLQDVESGESRPVAPRMLAGYQRRFEMFLKESRDALIRQGIDYTFATTDDPIAGVLRRYLLRRAA